MTKMKACHRHDTFFWIVCERCVFERMVAFAEKVRV